MGDQQYQNSDDDFSFDDVTNEGEEQITKDIVKNLRERLKLAEAERKEYLEGWQRAKADYVNSKREEDEERTKAIGRAKERIINDLLPVLDSFQVAFANKAAWEAVDKNWRVGVEYIHTKLLSTLEEHGVRAVGEVGEMFDPALHQSIESIEVDNERDDHKILEVLQKGYTIGGRVIRAARVKVGNYSKD